MQPEKTKAKKGLSLLERLRLKHPVDLGMELQGFIAKYQLEGTIDKKILVSSNGEFLGSGTTIGQAIDIVALNERRNNNEYDRTKIETTYVYQEEVVETRIREECMPKKFPKANGIEAHGKRFYIVKKKPNGSSSGKIFCLYNWDTRNLIFTELDKDMVMLFLIHKYKEIEYKDI